MRYAYIFDRRKVKEVLRGIEAGNMGFESVGEFIGENGEGGTLFNDIANEGLREIVRERGECRDRGGELGRCRKGWWQRGPEGG